jgi:hypothetical protein
MIIMHFPPGARGDFLGGFLLDTISERDNFAVRTPVRNYTKIHFPESFDFLDNQDAVKIRIDPNGDAVNYVQIAQNHINKNKPGVVLDDPMDQHYMFIKDLIKRDQKVYDHKHRYDYWIDFSIVNDFDFLWDLYGLVNKTTPDEQLLTRALDNIKQQTELSDNAKKLSVLLDFEIRFNLLDYYRSFDYDKFINTEDHRRLLKLSNYSQSKFL